MSTKNKRVRVPNALKDKVLREYRHRCAFCGRPEPQVHHIDEDPSHNDPENLIPLCPNCHLQDIHAPTEPIDPKKIALFRRFKDPAILDPRFHPLWERLRFLREAQEDRVVSWQYSCNDLVRFVSSLQMGEYYGKRVEGITHKSKSHVLVHLRKKGVDVADENSLGTVISDDEFIDIRASLIEALCVEMLRYQAWHPKEKP